MAEQPPPSEGEDQDEYLIGEILSRIGLAEGSLIDLLSALLLSAAVLASAFSAWQATLWGGEQSTLFAEASTARIQANRETGIALTKLSYDAGTFSDAMIAFTEDNQEILDLFDGLLFREEFKVFVDAWIELEPLKNPDAPRTPFELDGFDDQYLAEAMLADADADDKFDRARKANSNNDNYILGTVLFASVLFFSGVSTKFKSLWVRTFSVGVAGVALVVGLVWLISLPRLFHL